MLRARGRGEGIEVWSSGGGLQVCRRGGVEVLELVRHAAGAET